MNQGRTLRATLQSIISQDFEPYEIVVIDGGSKDNSVAVIKEFERHLKFWCSEPDGGQTLGIIKGFAHCSGDVLCWLNSDDVFTPGALRAVAEAFERDPASEVVYGDMLWLSEGGEVLGVKREIDMYPQVLLWGHNYIAQPSTFWKRDLYLRIGGLRNFECAMDFDLWVRFVGAGARFQYIPVVLSGFRKYAEQKNQRLRKISDEEDDQILADYLGRTPSRSERIAKRWFWRITRILIKAVRLKYLPQRQFSKTAFQEPSQ
jgi:glycosyltransferase involved in cell wall biosynthesis